MGREIARHPNALPRFIFYRAEARRAQAKIDNFKMYGLGQESLQQPQTQLSGALEQGKIITLPKSTVFKSEEPTDEALDFIRIYNDEEIDKIIEQSLMTA